MNGPAVAGGFELALSCDMRVVAETAFFAVPEARRGMGAHFASVVLPQMVPPGIAVEWLFSGRRIEIDEAERYGLVNRRAPPRSCTKRRSRSRATSRSRPRSRCNA